MPSPNEPAATTTPSRAHDPIRIVPLHLPRALVQDLPEHAAAAGIVDAPAGAAAAGTPQLTYRGGPLLSSVEVVTIYWGEAWTSAPLDQLATDLDAFFDAVLGSELLDQLAEYDVPGQTIGHGTRSTRVVLPHPKPAHVVSDTRIRRLLRSVVGVDGSGVPAAAPNRLFFVYLPPGSTVTQGGGRSCQAFCGYHDHIDETLFYAAMPYPGCNGCTGGLDVLPALTSTSSHELVEAITDPVPGSGWYDDAHGEIGDICAWQTKQVAGYTVQLEWSNQAGACV